MGDDDSELKFLNLKIEISLEAKRLSVFAGRGVASLYIRRLGPTNVLTYSCF